MKYRIITEFGQTWDGPWHRWIEHDRTVEFSRPVTAEEAVAPLMEVEGVPIRIRYELVRSGDGEQL